MHNHFKINVAKQQGLTWDRKPRYVHFFFAEVRDEAEARVVYAEMRKRFPLAEGFHVSITEWRGSGSTPAWGV